MEVKIKNLELKKQLTPAPLLQYPDPQKPYKLEMDASDLAIGAVLRISHLKGIYQLHTN